MTTLPKLMPLFPGLRTQGITLSSGQRMATRMFENIPSGIKTGTTRLNSAFDKLTFIPKVTRDFMGSFMHFFTKQFGQFDYQKFASVFGTKASASPKGSFIVQLYPFVIGPRLYYAWKRAPIDPETGKKDRGEMKDVMRRDMFVVTVFLFAFEPLRMFGARLIEMATGIRLLKKDGPLGGREELAFSSIDENFFVDSHKRLLGLALDDKNRKGLPQAARSMHLEGEPKLLNRLWAKLRGKEPSIAKDSPLLAQKQQFCDALNELLQGIKQAEQTHGAPLTPEAWAKGTIPDTLMQALETKAKSAFEILDTMSTHHQQVLDAAQHVGHNMAQGVRKELKNPRAFLGNYAKLMGLPVHAAAMAIIVFLLGYAPVKLNAKWSDKHYQEKLQKQSGQTATHGSPPKNTPQQQAQPALSLWTPAALSPTLTAFQPPMTQIQNAKYTPWVLPTTSLWNQPTMMLPTQPR